jgi:surface protein
MRRYFFSFILLLFGTIYALAATEYEYWLDDDYANRITGIIESSAQSFEIDVSKLQPGIHYLTYRAKANSTEWGAITRSMFYMADIQETAHATLLEYWLDNDYNNRQSVSANDGAMSISQHLDALQPGIHYLNIRLKGDTEQWGTICRHMMYIYEADPDDPCTLTEWWFDNNYKDRQTDNTGQTQISLTESVAHMQPGIHYFNIRSQGQSGRWGATSRYMFYLYDQPKETTATAVNYWIDGDYAQKQTISLDNGHAVMLVDLGLISTGKHMFNMECITDSGETCLLSSVSFKVGIEDILPWGTEEPWESKYVENGSRDNYTEPATDVNGKGWTELSFDDSAWQTLTGPIANNTDIIEPVNFNWPNEVGGLNLRRTFTMDSVPNGKYQLLMKHDDAVRVYLNNQLVVESYDCGTDFVYDIPSTALQVGENILAIYIDQFGGNNYLDYCLRYLDQQTEPEPYAVLSDNDTKLTFYYDENKTEHNGMSVEVFELPQDRGWESVAHNITTVEFDTSIANDTTITSTAYWFYGCQELTSIIGMENLKTQSVTDMKYMFYNCNELEHVDVSGFNTANVTDMSGMFYKCHRLQELDLSNFNTFKVKNMSWMFYGCYDINRIYAGSYWTTTSVTESEEMFMNCTNLVGGHGTTYDENRIDYTFAHIDGGASNPGYFTDKNATIVTNPEPYAVLTEVNSNPNEGTITPNSTRAETATTSNYTLTFYYDEHKEERGGISVERGWANAAENITTVVFDESFANYTELTSTADWFGGCSNLTSIVGISNLKTDNVTDMSYMFRGCFGLESLDVSEFKTDKVMNMQGMFYGCYGLASLDLSNFNTANVTDVGEMFCYSSGLMSLNVSGFNTANMTNMGGMFKFCSGLASLDVSSFNTVNVTSMKDMFYGCSGLTSLDVSSFNTNNVTVMEEMFSDCSSLTTIYVGEGWSTEKVTNGKDVFFGCTDLVGGKGTVFDPDHTDASYAHIDGGVNNPGYFTQIGGEIMATYENYVLTVEGDMSMAQALEQVGGHDVVANDIAAIVWNSTQALTSSDIESFGNPNLLIYVQADSLAPEGVNNVVIDGKAKNIVLVDAEGNNNFYAPQAFTAEEISYTRNFQQQTQVGVSRGWEGICLPFTVESYTHENHGTIAPFHNNASNYHFWLHQMTDQGMDNATTIEANKPYIISMPNSDAYPEAYNQAGKVTFAASNATVPASDNSAYWSPDGSIALMSTYLRIEPSEYIYALNVGNAIESYAEGSVFVKNYREVRPFEAYTFHEQNQGAGARFISLSSLFGGEGTTGIIDVITVPDGDTWYDMNGRRLQSKPVRQGIYIKNGKKIVVK